MNKEKIKTFKRCPYCGSHDIAKFEVDHFCLSCDWDTLFSDVQSGAFEKRIGLQETNKILSQSAREGNVVFIEDLKNSISTEISEKEIVA